MASIPLGGGLGAAWAVLIVVGAWRHRPPRGRLRRLMSAERPLGQPSGSGNDRPHVGLVVAHAARIVAGPIGFVGGTARRVVGLPADPVADRRLGIALAVGVSMAALALPLAVPMGLVAWCVPWMAERRGVRRRDDRVLDELPDAVDLLRLALGSGTSLRLAVADLAPRCGPTIGSHLAGVDERLNRGASLAEALSGLRGLGEPFRPVLDAMLLSERNGAPITPLLDRIAGDARGARRRRAEEVARRVPVKLLFPLVFCTLPAFGLAKSFGRVQIRSAVITSSRRVRACRAHRLVEAPTAAKCRSGCPVGGGGVPH